VARGIHYWESPRFNAQVCYKLTTHEGDLMLKGVLLNQSFLKCVFSLGRYGDSDDHFSRKCLRHFIEQTTQWLWGKQSKNRACRGTMKGITTLSKSARCSKTSTGLLQSLDMARILLSGLPGIRGLQTPSVSEKDCQEYLYSPAL
jgi:hypothetical protein